MLKKPNPKTKKDLDAELAALVTKYAGRVPMDDIVEALQEAKQAAEESGES